MVRSDSADGGVNKMWVNAVATIVSLAAFLLALRVMRMGLENMGVGRLQSILHRFVRTPTRGILSGTLITALLQSSAAITAITVGLVAAGTLEFRDAIGVVLGANVGSTITPQLLTLDLWMFAVPCLFLGGVGLFSHKPRYRNISLAVVGFSSIFISLQALTTALHPLARTDWFEHILEIAGAHLFIALVGGMITSALMQSSTATTVLTMALAADGAIPLTSGIAIVLGANVGTCLTSIIAAIGQSRAAQQVALSHVLLNVGGALVFLPLLQPYAAWMETWTHDPAQQIANAHTFFNVLCTLAAWPITRPFARLVEWILPNKRYA